MQYVGAWSFHAAWSIFSLRLTECNSEAVSRKFSNFIFYFVAAQWSYSEGISWALLYLTNTAKFCLYFPTTYLLNLCFISSKILFAANYRYCTCDTLSDEVNKKNYFQLIVLHILRDHQHSIPSVWTDRNIMFCTQNNFVYICCFICFLKIQ